MHGSPAKTGVPKLAASIKVHTSLLLAGLETQKSEKVTKMKKTAQVMLVGLFALVLSGCIGGPGMGGGVSGELQGAAVQGVGNVARSVFNRGGDDEDEKKEAEQEEMERAEAPLDQERPEADALEGLAENMDSEAADRGYQAALEMSGATARNPGSIAAMRSAAGVGMSAGLAGEGMGAAFRAMQGESEVSHEEVQNMSHEVVQSDPYTRDGRTCVDYIIKLRNVPGEADRTEETTACETSDGGWEEI